MVRYAPSHLKGTLAVRVFACFAFAYALSYAFRSVNAVIAPELERDLQITHAQLGLLTSAYFFSFALLQLPLGVLLDRYGPRRVEAILLLFAVAGALLFALASDFALLWIARALIGIGVSACLMASYKAFAMWFPAAQQPSLASWMLMSGSLGALISTSPVAAALPFLGWRGVFIVVAALTLIAALVIFFMIPREPPRAHSTLPTWREQFASFQGIFTDARFWCVAPACFLMQGGFMAVQSLWAGPWLTEVEGLTPEHAAHVLFGMNASLMVGYLGLGLAVHWLQRRGVSLARILSVGMIAALAVIALIVLRVLPWPLLPWMLLGLCVCVTTLLYPEVTLAFPVALTGRVSTALNLLVFVGAFVLQTGIGVLIDAGHAAGLSLQDAFQVTFIVLLTLQAAAVIWFVVQSNRLAAIRKTKGERTESVVVRGEG